jgi:hypothetical protein
MNGKQSGAAIFNKAFIALNEAKQSFGRGNGYWLSHISNQSAME